MVGKVTLGQVYLPVRQINCPLQTAIVKKQFRSVGIVVTWVNDQKCWYCCDVDKRSEVLVLL